MLKGKVSMPLIYVDEADTKLSIKEDLAKL